MMDPDTGDMRQLTQSKLFKRYGRYSPDGAEIAFTGGTVAPAVSRLASAAHSFGVFLMNSDGSGERALTVDPRLSPGAGVDPFLDANLLDWCHAGKWLDASWKPE